VKRLKVKLFIGLFAILGKAESGALITVQRNIQGLGYGG
jgi:hypothetical protein